MAKYYRIPKTPTTLGLTSENPTGEIERISPEGLKGLSTRYGMLPVPEMGQEEIMVSIQKRIKEITGRMMGSSATMENIGKIGRKPPISISPITPPEMPERKIRREIPERGKLEPPTLPTLPPKEGILRPLSTEPFQQMTERQLQRKLAKLEREEAKLKLKLK